MFSPKDTTTTTRCDQNPRSHGTAEVVLMDLDQDETSSCLEANRLIVGIDFGTTYSAVSYLSLGSQESTDKVSPSRIRSIRNFPDQPIFNFNDPMTNEVPTEVIYPLDPKFRQHEHDASMIAETATVNDTPGVMDGQESPDLNVGSGLDLENFLLEDDSMSIDDSRSFQWGYGVHELWSIPATHRDGGPLALSLFKLLLDESASTEETRNHLLKKIDALKRKKLIKHLTDVIADYLTCLLRHTQDQLRQENFDHTHSVEIVLCVPAIWSQKACRQMQTALAQAISRSGFMGVQVQNNSIENLFIVSEPEAAAAYMLIAQKAIRMKETFLMLDAGGGTVDANTYTVSEESPLRLMREVVTPGGGMCGSSFLNASFRDVLRDMLKDETYLEQGSETIKGIVERIVINDFEHKVKRNFDPSESKRRNMRKTITVPGVRDNPEKGFKDGTVALPIRKITESFIRLSKEIADIMEKQLTEAMESGTPVKRVLLIGGFGASRFLQKYLKKHLEEFCRKRRCADIVLHDPQAGQNICTAVASGAVIRACNKEQGPQRQARSSYAIMRTEPYREFPEHDGQRASYDKHDGQRYVMKTLLWVLKRGQQVPPVWESERIPFTHTFQCKEPALICKEEIYVSDHATESHYGRTHPKNLGAEKVGEMVADFTFLRDQGHIHPIDPGRYTNGKRIGAPHYKVEYDVVLRVVDRDLKCYAMFDNKIMKKCRINIAAGFNPGVK